MLSRRNAAPRSAAADAAGRTAARKSEKSVPCYFCDAMTDATRAPILKKTISLLAIFLTILTVAACNREHSAREMKTVPANTFHDEDSPAMGPSARDAKNLSTPDTKSVSGTVIETMNTTGYTYVQVDTGSEKIWAAAPEFPVKVGDHVVVPEGAPMPNYHSKTLNRDFAVVYFVNSIQNESGGAPTNTSQLPTGHPPTAASPTPPQIDVTGVKKADGGVTIGELYAKKADLSGKEVTLRGKVVKFNPQIMGKNWLHVRDGTGEADKKTNDLAVTTDATVAVGDTVLVNGKLDLNKDFGYGYKYDAIIENAKVKRE